MGKETGIDKAEIVEKDKRSGFQLLAWFGKVTEHVMKGAPQPWTVWLCWLVSS